ncbi:MAG: glycosyltransferase family 4 protein [Bacilli bacterium]|jgi:1,2-diacylglycerol-3-alpha-glucose alpha-1,2-glucosyltransferase|nr:glycosyltransferase family 4 protein [Bacilli bacterium]
MKVFLYFENRKAIQSSGIGHAENHQMIALRDAKVPFTLNPFDKFDLAHINTVWLKSHVVLRQCRRKGVPVIVHGHSTHEDFRRSFFGWQLAEPYVDRALDYMYGHADCIITPTPYSKGLIERYKGVNCPVYAISNGIDLPSYAPDEEAKKAFREKYGVKEGEKLVIGVGFPFERKGLDDFFRVAKKMPDVKFMWFGSLMRVAISLPIKRALRHKPSNVVMAGYAKGRLIRGAYQAASVFFFPSREETEGIVVLEALASRTPSVLRDIGAYKPWLKDGINCHLRSDVEGFAKAIRELLERGEDPRILEAGYQVAAERDLPKIGERLKAVYEKVLASGKASK